MPCVGLTPMSAEHFTATRILLPVCNTAKGKNLGKFTHLSSQEDKQIATSVLLSWTIRLLLSCCLIQNPQHCTDSWRSQTLSVWDAHMSDRDWKHAPRDFQTGCLTKEISKECSLNGGRRDTHLVRASLFSKPSKTSVLMLRSCASSTMMAPYLSTKSYCINV